MPVATRTAPTPTAVAVSEAAYQRLGDALADFRAHGEVAAAMIARLHAILDRWEALPATEPHRIAALAGLYLGCRYGPLPRPLPPGAWAWPHTLREWHIRAHGPAVVARAATLAVSPELRRDLPGVDAGLWRDGYPQEAEDELDRRAAKAGVDIRARQRLEVRQAGGKR